MANDFLFFVPKLVHTCVNWFSQAWLWLLNFEDSTSYCWRAMPIRRCLWRAKKKAKSRRS